MVVPKPTSDAPPDFSKIASGSTDTNSVDLFSTGKIGSQDVLTGVNRHESSDSTMSPAMMAKLRSMEPNYPTTGPVGLYHKSPDLGPTTATVNELIRDLITKATGTPSQRAEFEATQKKLFEAGLYGTDKPEDITWGVWTDATRKAALKWYTAAAQQRAMKSTQTATEWLDQAAKANIESTLRYGDSTDYGLTPKGLGSSGSQAQVVNRFTDPQVVAQYLQSTAQSELGRNLSNKELRTFTDAFHKMEVGYNNAANNNTAATLNLTAPDAAAQAQAFVEQKHPNEVAGERMASYVQALDSMLGGVS